MFACIDRPASRRLTILTMLPGMNYSVLGILFQYAMMLLLVLLVVVVVVVVVVVLLLARSFESGIDVHCLLYRRLTRNPGVRGCK